MSECCAIPLQAENAERCPACGEKGRAVGLVTLDSLLTDAARDRLERDRPYFFCAGRECPVVYFCDDARLFFEKTDLRVPVGLKEREGAAPVCYCFGHTEASIAEEIRETGKSTVIDSITAKVKARECACERTNPQGRCCLGNVTLAVKRAMAR